MFWRDLFEVRVLLGSRVIIVGRISFLGCGEKDTWKMCSSFFFLLQHPVAIYMGEHEDMSCVYFLCRLFSISSSLTLHLNYSADHYTP